MIGKILHGSAFGGLVKYVNDSRKMATLVAASDGVNLSNSQNHNRQLCDASRFELSN